MKNKNIMIIDDDCIEYSDKHTLEDKAVKFTRAAFGAARATKESMEKEKESSGMALMLIGLILIPTILHFSFMKGANDTINTHTNCYMNQNTHLYDCSLGQSQNQGQLKSIPETENYKAGELAYTKKHLYMEAQADERKMRENEIRAKRERRIREEREERNDNSENSSKWESM